ncbi:hypothetical protein RHIZ404_230432 [Rhizobium sp. EC-SD404]|nr:hypothetical protein RHIZ404_230432 [Rhizobium sp. EC-SD404]
MFRPRTPWHKARLKRWGMVRPTLKLTLGYLATVRGDGLQKSLFKRACGHRSAEKVPLTLTAIQSHKICLERRFDPFSDHIKI